LKEFINRKIETHYQIRKEQIHQLLGSQLGQAMKEQVVHAAEKAKSFSTIKNVLNPKAFNSFFEHTYQAVIKSPLAKTAVAIKNVARSVREKIGDIKVPTRIEVHSVQAANGINFVHVSTETTPLKEIIRESRVNKQDGIGTVGGTSKGSGENPDVVKFTEEQLSTKPPYSRDPEKWQKKGGEIEVSEEGIWTFIDWEIPPNRVSYPGGFPDFKSADLVRQQAHIGEFTRYDVDFAKADELAPNGPKLDENTWHHHQDLTTMQEINKELHRRFTHMGGMSLAKKSKE
jgi:hypothetical protein